MANPENRKPESMNAAGKIADPADFESEINGEKTDLFILGSDDGMKVSITNYGGRIVNWLVPDRNGKQADVVLGYDTIDGYLNSNEVYFGALIGRYGNRIADGRFSLKGAMYNLESNNPPNHLHGGVKGFHNVVWKARKYSDRYLQLHYYSKDGEEGYPGNLKVQVLYILLKDNELMIDYTAVTDAVTVINLTSHAFFNLKGAVGGKITGHELMINADQYTPVDSTLIPTGAIDPVRNTPFDFLKPTPIGARLDANHQQLEYGYGYDHNYVLNKSSEGALDLAAVARDPVSGREMELFTTEPGMQFFSGNFLDGSDIGREGLPYEFRTAFCLEPQHFPDSPNQPAFPSTELHPGDIYRSVSIFRFSAK